MGKKVKMTKKEKQLKKKFKSIGTKLVLMFSIIIILALAVVGVSANLKSTQILTDTYKSTVYELISETSHSVETYFDKFDSIISIFAANPNVRKATANAMYEERLLELMTNIYDTEDDILALYYVSKKGKIFYLPGNDIEADPDFVNRDWYVAAVESDGLAWSQPYPDSQTGESVITVSKAVYNTNGSSLYGVVGIDISLKTLENILNEIKIGKKGYPTLINEEFITLTHKDANIIGEKVPITKIIDAISSGDSEPVDYSWEEEGKMVDKFAVYHEIEGKGLYILATMYTSEIEEETKSILYFIAVIAVISLIVAVVASLLFANSLTKVIKKLLGIMEKVKDGDLSIDVEVKSNDEIGMLSNYFGETVLSIGSLLKNVTNVSNELSESAQSLAATAEETSASADEVSRTVEEIAGGASNQATDAEEGAIIAKALSVKFENLSENTDDLLVSTKRVVDSNLEGLEAIKSLKEKTVLSEEANEEIEIIINELDKKSQNISNILDAISSIAEQTNLLALNASIEAARAGEHGRGFAVVADEIRKLAEESSKSAEEIREIVSNIQADSKKTVSSMSELKDIASQQSGAVDLVGGAFDSISVSVEEMSTQIDKIGGSVTDLEKDKEAIVNSIENISAVSEETAAAAEEVTATMDQQTYAVEEVAKAAEVLNEISVHLKTELTKFKLD